MKPTLNRRWLYRQDQISNGILFTPIQTEFGKYGMYGRVGEIITAIRKMGDYKKVIY